MARINCDNGYDAGSTNAAGERHGYGVFRRTTGAWTAARSRACGRTEKSNNRQTVWKNTVKGGAHGAH